MNVTQSLDHPLSKALSDAVEGRFPPVDGVVDVVPPDGAGTHAVVEFTGHSFVLTDLGVEDELLGEIDAFGGATQPHVLIHLAGRSGSIGSLDLVMVRRVGPPTTEPLDQIDDVDHPRVRRALDHRREVEVFGDQRGIVTFGIGLVGRQEISIELNDRADGGGVGRQLLEAALATRKTEEVVFAQVAPGNAASVRMFLSCGFVPIASEVLIERRV